MRVVFMGTPDFAVPTLEMLVREHETVLCITREDAPKGRGGKMSMPPVKETAIKYGIPVYQPKSARTPEFYETVKNAEADVIVTCAYGKILPENVLTAAPYGVVNVHASLLPKYRGAAPIWHAVLNGEKESGITTMQTDAGMDTGDILLVERVLIGPDTTTGELHDILAQLAPTVLMKTLAGLERDVIKPQPQDGSAATYAPMVGRETGQIDWSGTAEKIVNTVRGTNPYPGASSTLDGRRVKIIRARIAEHDGLFAEPGVCISENGRLIVACGSGAVEVCEIQGEGTRKMTAEEYLNGHSADKFI